MAGEEAAAAGSPLEGGAAAAAAAAAAGAPAAEAAAAAPAAAATTDAPAAAAPTAAAAAEDKGDGSGGSSKRRCGVSGESACVGAASVSAAAAGAAHAKRRKTGGGGEAAAAEGGKGAKQKSREEMSTEELLAVLKRQVEYYLSNANLSTDSFFHDKIQEAERQGKGVSLKMTYVLSSPRMKALHATEEEVIAALADSSELKIHKDEDSTTWVQRREALPPLRRREKKSNKNIDDNSIGRDPHAVGCFLRLTHSAAAAAAAAKWQSIKDALRETLPQKVLVRYVSRMNSQQQCTVWLSSFKGDREFFKDSLKLQVEGQEATLTLMSPGEVRAACNSDLPPRVRTCREKELQQFRRQIAGLPLSLGGASFNSVDHLNKCMHDLLDKTEAGKTLKKDSVAEKAVLALLDFHPNAFIKKGGHDRHPIGIKVDLHAKTNKDGSPSKCFFVIRQHKESKEEDAEDFSVSKCLSELSRNPPVLAEALDNFMQQRYELAAAAFDAAQQQMQKKKAAAAAAAAAAAGTGDAAAKQSTPTPAAEAGNEEGSSTAAVKEEDKANKSPSLATEITKDGTPQSANKTSEDTPAAASSTSTAGQSDA
ncbi:la domain-containing protein, putative [Eimeria acervulina]|uniref:La domain-containing protein, putative n=1 Tax=Eimeria acervulina TaxID=5801 RepID=U6GFB1_EIMAC|nr:la domain-containing protein, putative [Eimeria acervulina]CDI78941.1 la domain-containing protein, putative [Eimeria acervulina]